jgi:hypothetical protein
VLLLRTGNETGGPRNKPPADKQMTESLTPGCGPLTRSAAGSGSRCHFSVDLARRGAADLRRATSVESGCLASRQIK